MNENTLQIYPVLEMSPWQVDGGEDLNLKEGQTYTEFAIEVFKKHGINNIERLDEHGYSSIKMSDINAAAVFPIIKIGLPFWTMRRANGRKFGLDTRGYTAELAIILSNCRIISNIRTH